MTIVTPRTRGVVLALGAVLLLSACGQTGPQGAPTTVATVAAAPLPAAEHADDYAGGAPLLRDLTVPAGSAPTRAAKVVTQGAGQAGYATLVLREDTTTSQVVQDLVGQASRAGYQEVARDGASVRLERTDGERLRRLELGGADRNDEVPGHVSVILVDSVAP